MKLEDLKSCRINPNRFNVDLVFSSEKDVEAAKIYFGWPDEDFYDLQTALLAAARFRASEEMYQALKSFVDTCNKHNLEFLVPEYEAAVDALAMADNTNETL